MILFDKKEIESFGIKIIRFNNKEVLQEPLSVLKMINDTIKELQSESSVTPSGAGGLKAMIFSAGLGTRFKPWTDSHPKALALVNGKSLLQRNFKSLDGINDKTNEVGTTQSGFNQNETQWITAGAKKDVGFTTKMQEYSGSPVTNLFRYWNTGIRDPDPGVALYPQWANIEYSAKNHTAEFLYIQFRPDVTNGATGSNIEYASYITNAAPTITQESHYNYNPGSKNMTEYSQTWTGNKYHSPKVMELAATVVKSGIATNFIFEGDWKPTGQN